MYVQCAEATPSRFFFFFKNFKIAEFNSFFFHPFQQSAQLPKISRSSSSGKLIFFFFFFFKLRHIFFFLISSMARSSVTLHQKQEVTQEEDACSQCKSQSPHLLATRLPAREATIPVSSRVSLKSRPILPNPALEWYANPAHQ